MRQNVTWCSTYNIYSHRVEDTRRYYALPCGNADKGMAPVYAPKRYAPICCRPASLLLRHAKCCQDAAFMLMLEMRQAPTPMLFNARCRHVHSCSCSPSSRHENALRTGRFLPATAKPHTMPPVPGVSQHMLVGSPMLIEECWSIQTSCPRARAPLYRPARCPQCRFTLPPTEVRAGMAWYVLPLGRISRWERTQHHHRFTQLTCPCPPDRSNHQQNVVGREAPVGWEGRWRSRQIGTDPLKSCHGSGNGRPRGRWARVAASGGARHAGARRTKSVNLSMRAVCKRE